MHILPPFIVCFTRSYIYDGMTEQQVRTTYSTRYQSCCKHCDHQWNEILCCERLNKRKILLLELKKTRLEEARYIWTMRQDDSRFAWIVSCATSVALAEHDRGLDKHLYAARLVDRCESDDLLTSNTRHPYRNSESSSYRNGISSNHNPSQHRWLQVQGGHTNTSMHRS